MPHQHNHSGDVGLSFFHPLIESYFLEIYGQPTEVQSKAWPIIASGKHLLVTAPTGSGKTLTAFLHAIHQFASGDLDRGKIKVLYISPLKALNRDIELNLQMPLTGLRDYFHERGEKFPEIRTMVRSGDTPQSERRKLFRNPPEIFITTPESLNVLLLNRAAPELFSSIELVILDEIHAVAGNKRGVYLMTAIERLVEYSGEFQRICLSATIRPPERTARFVAGRQWHNGVPVNRPMEIVRSTMKKDYDLQVDFPSSDTGSVHDEDELFAALTLKLLGLIRENKSTLIFTNSRRMSEKIARLLNESQPGVAYTHHGSLSREIRRSVEEALKKGDLPCVVATNSLELGIDIGDLDLVIQVQTPRTLSSALQRAGRAGHGVGRISRGVFLPTFGMDVLSSAVLTETILDSGLNIEEIHPVESPLDVLSQVILSMTLVREWDVDELYHFFLTVDSYGNLSRNQFDLVVHMLTGRYAQSRIRELKSRVYLDSLTGKLRAREGGERLLYMSGGVIPDRGYYDLRIAEGKAKIGELDEEFVWERSVGDVFQLGAQNWRILKIDHNSVEVAGADRNSAMAPFWRAEEQDRDFVFAERIALFLEEAEQFIRDGRGEKIEDSPLMRSVLNRFPITENAARVLVEFLLLQREVSRTDLPHRRHIVLELVNDGGLYPDRRQLVIHTMRGGRVNRPFMVALRKAFQKKYGILPEAIHDDNCVMMILPGDFQARDIFELVNESNVETLLREGLSQTGFFGSLFRQNAGIAMLLPGRGFQKRTPLWFNRLRSQKILESISRYQDFPVMLETYRTALQDHFDLVNLNKFIGEIGSGWVRISEIHTKEATPFASNLVWRQTNFYMYEPDKGAFSSGTLINRNMYQEIAGNTALRPVITADVIEKLEGKLHGIAPGYECETMDDLLELVRDRLILPEKQWKTFVGVHRESGLLGKQEQKALWARTETMNFPGSDTTCHVHRDQRERVRSTLSTNTEQKDMAFDQILYEYLQYQAVVPVSELKAIFGDSPVDEALQDLTEEERVVCSVISERGVVEAATTDNMEILLRMMRAKSSVVFETRPFGDLALFLAKYQKIQFLGEAHEGVPESAIDESLLMDVMESLILFPARAGAWEGEILPVRIHPYSPVALDDLLSVYDLTYFGIGKEKICFGMHRDRELIAATLNELSSPEENEESTPHGSGEVQFPETGSHDFQELMRYTKLSSGELNDAIWNRIWTGRLTSRDFAPVRRGLDLRFKLTSGGSAGRAVRSRRWIRPQGLPGEFRMLDPPEVSLLDEDLKRLRGEDENRERIRLLLDRYGILFRELLLKELPELQWKRLVRSMRIMELSGELLSGYFFEGIAGLQFMSPSSFRALSEGLDRSLIFMINATDPASLCGLGLDETKQLPARIPANHILYQGGDILLVSRKRGHELDIHVNPDHEGLAKGLFLFQRMPGRMGAPSRIVVDRINGQPVGNSPYKDLFVRAGFVMDYRSLVLRKQYG